MSRPVLKWETGIHLEPFGSGWLIRIPGLELAWQDVDSSFERFCLTAGIAGRGRPSSSPVRRVAAQAVWATAGAGQSKIGFHNREVTVHRRRVRVRWRAADLDGGAGRGLARPLGDEHDAD